jgi:transcriptional regulator with XRE-family HTH domain
LPCFSHASAIEAHLKHSCNNKVAFIFGAVKLLLEMSEFCDFWWDKNRLGRWLRYLREYRGYSLRQLEVICGLPNSEIYKIEVGHQECRIEKLFQLCTALGVSAGWILDRSLCSNPGIFKHALSIEAIEELWRHIDVKDASLQQRLINTLSIACSRAAVLLRASDAPSLSRADDYPHPEWRERFLRFADALANMGGESMDKTSILGRLLVFPLAEMTKQHLVAENALKAEAVNYCLPRNQKKDFGWPLEIPLRDNPIDTAII